MLLIFINKSLIFFHCEENLQLNRKSFLITAKQIRAARALLGWSQQELADAVNLSKPTIVDAEKTGHQSRPETLSQIIETFENSGLEFMSGGVRERDDILRVFTGESAYLQLLDYIYVSCANEASEVLYYCADEKRTPSDVMNREISMREAGITQRALLKTNDTNIMGDLEEYRWMPDKLWSDSDVKVIFSGHVAYLISWHNETKVLMIKDKMISDIEKRFFNFVWDISAKPTHSTAKTRYSDV